MEEDIKIESKVHFHEEHFSFIFDIFFIKSGIESRILICDPAITSTRKDWLTMYDAIQNNRIYILILSENGGQKMISNGENLSFTIMPSNKDDNTFMNISMPLKNNKDLLLQSIYKLINDERVLKCWI